MTTADRLEIARQLTQTAGYCLPARYHQEVRRAILTFEDTTGTCITERYLYRHGWLRWEYWPDGFTVRTWSNIHMTVTEIFRNGKLVEGWVKELQS